MPMDTWRLIARPSVNSSAAPDLCRPRRRRWWAATAALSVVFALCVAAGAPAGAAAPDVDGDTLVVVGDLVPGPGGSLANAQAVHDVATRLCADAYVFAGDLQYERGELANYQNRWQRIWGGEFSRSYPAAGNHEYGDGANSGWAATGGGYFDYWGSRARPSGASYYSFDVNLPGGGHWHVVVLNSACGNYDNPPQWYTPSCALDGAMEDWLRADLAADDAMCELAVFHEPAFATKAPHAGNTAIRTPWWTMEERGVDLVVSGHNHAYEYFGPQLHTGASDYSKGIRSVIVGTGGRSLIPFSGTVAANSIKRITGVYGVLTLSLRANGVTTAFKNTAGTTLDAHSFGCH
jgi:acid phosphatase type 7